MHRAQGHSSELETTTELASFQVSMKTISVFYCLLYATWTEGADIKVEGLEGGEVSFQCSHKLAWKNNKYFCKNQCKKTEDILVTVKSGTREESGRITLVDLGTGVFNVTFGPLQLSDSGRYWCGVDRPGFDTFTAVILTVKEVIVNETTTAIPHVSSTWTYQNISKSTQVTSRMDTSLPTNQSTGLNCTNGGEHSMSTSTVLYAIVGGVSALTVLVLATRFRKCREISKPQQQVCPNRTDFVTTDNREQFDSEYDDIDKVPSLKILSERTSCAHHPKPKQEPPTPASTKAEESASHLHIYENICCSRRTPGSGHSAANIHNNCDITSGMYIKPLPPIPARTGGRCVREHTNKARATGNATSRAAEGCTSSVSAGHSTSCPDSMESRPRSLWFGLDISGTV